MGSPPPADADMGSPRGTKVLAASLCAITVLVGIVGLVVGVTADLPPSEGDIGGPATVIVVVFLILTFAGVGALMSIRLPRNPVGWGFLALGLIFSIGMSSETYAQYSFEVRDVPLPGASVLAWLTAVTIDSAALFAPVLLFVYFFPTGRLLSARWRVLFWVGVGAAAAVSLDRALKPGPLDVAPIDNPFGVKALEGLFEPALQISFYALAVSLLAGVACLIVRFRRAGGVERQQIKWFLAAVSVLAGSVALAPVVFWTSWAPEWLWAVVFFTCFSFLPITAAISIFKYRLYDIDLIINRALLYLGVTIVLGAVYVVGVLVIGQALRGLAGTRENDVAVAATTLLVAALFRPARARLQTFIDRRFYHHKYDAQRTIETFISTLRQEIELEALSHELIGVVQRTMEPTYVSLWLHPGTGTGP